MQGKESPQWVSKGDYRYRYINILSSVQSLIKYASTIIVKQHQSLIGNSIPG